RSSGKRRKGSRRDVEPHLPMWHVWLLFWRGVGVARAKIGAQPKGAAGYRGGASFLAEKKTLDHGAAHGVEVFGDRERTREEAQPADPFTGEGIQSGDLDHGLSGLGNDEGFAAGGFIDQARQVRFCLTDVDGVHGYV